jgi:hypothetical protein
VRYRPQPLRRPARLACSAQQLMRFALVPTGSSRRNAPLMYRKSWHGLSINWLSALVSKQTIIGRLTNQTHGGRRHHVQRLVSNLIELISIYDILGLQRKEATAMGT